MKNSALSTAAATAKGAKLDDRAAELRAEAEERRELATRAAPEYAAHLTAHADALEAQAAALEARGAKAKAKQD